MSMYSLPLAFPQVYLTHTHTHECRHIYTSIHTHTHSGSKLHESLSSSVADSHRSCVCVCVSVCVGYKYAYVRGVTDCPRSAEQTATVRFIASSAWTRPGTCAGRKCL